MSQSENSSFPWNVRIEIDRLCSLTLYLDSPRKPNANKNDRFLHLDSSFFEKADFISSKKVAIENFPLFERYRNKNYQNILEPALRSCCPKMLAGTFLIYTQLNFQTRVSQKQSI